DRDRPRMVKRHDGTQPQASRIAALLIFQPGPMPASILETCDLLTGLGYGVLVVSNGPLLPASRGALLPHVWRVLERPNLGYDFGGYREAVMHLWDEKADPDELLILNDSVWIVASVFPAFLDQLRALNAEVTGSVMRSKKGKRWIESYFFRITRPALTHPAFRKFWLDYRLVDSKFGVIRQGERDFTVALAEGGLQVAALGDNAEFLAALAKAPDEELRIALTYAAPVTGGLAEDRARLLASTPEPHWRTRALAHFGVVLDGKRVWNSQFPVAAQRRLAYPFIKKSREQSNFVLREQVLAGIEDRMFAPATSAAMSELVAQQRRGPDFEPAWMPTNSR
ncbi:MAG: hypothetical protein EOP02_31815, partial [Proteobacteria bacterium]